MTLPIAWTFHLQNDAEAKQQLELAVRNSTVALGRLYEILEEKEATIVKKEISSSTYASPSYPYEQAFHNGRRAGLLEIRELIQFIKQG